MMSKSNFVSYSISTPDDWEPSPFNFHGETLFKWNCFWFCHLSIKPKIEEFFINPLIGVKENSNQFVILNENLWNDIDRPEYILECNNIVDDDCFNYDFTLKMDQYSLTLLKLLS